MATISTEADYERELTLEMGECSLSIERFVYTAFPWGSGELADFEGPDQWQLDILRAIDGGLVDLSEAIQIAVASGHGTGKSCLASWVILWSISTFEDTRGVVTANTETQLRTKTWAELGKWFRLLICKHWFKLTATAIFSAQPGRDRTWRIDMVPWSENNVEAFAGLHNQGRRLLLLFDEGSAIPDVIWETASGALTDKNTEIIWAVFGNPTRPTGRFHGCFHRFRHRWSTFQIDSRDVAVTNKGYLDSLVEDWGEDSDYVRVRVRGVFPRTSASQFISGELIDEAVARYLEVEAAESSPLILGVDIARFGDDQSVILARQGRKVLWIKSYRGKDNHEMAMEIWGHMDLLGPDAVFIDSGGGDGVIDILKAQNRKVTEVHFGATKTVLKPQNYLNKRAEMWGEMAAWLAVGGIPDDQELIDDLNGPQYKFAREAVIQLEKKEDMKKRGIASPDKGDALALTFFAPVLKKQTVQTFKRNRKKPRYNPLTFRP
ncbi:MAG: terminase [Geminicoccaceae bacterium]